MQTAAQVPVQKDVPKEKTVRHMVTSFSWNHPSFLHVIKNSHEEMGTESYYNRMSSVGYMRDKCCFCFSCWRWLFYLMSHSRTLRGWVNLLHPQQYKQEKEVLFCDDVFVYFSAGCQNSRQMSKRKNHPQEIPQNLELFGKSFLTSLSRVHCGKAGNILVISSHQLLLDWIKKSGYPPALYTLCTSYPRTPLLTAADVSLEDAGILMHTVLNVEEKDPSTR